VSTPRKRLLDQRPPLIKRFLHLKARRIGKDFARFIIRPILQYKERGRRNSIASALTEIAKQSAKCRACGLKSSAIVYDLALYFLLAERDIQVVKIDALTHPDKGKRSLCARVILLTIHELDFDKVAGLKLRTALDTVKAPEETKLRVMNALRTLRSVQKKARKEFAYLRNNTIAHRDSDPFAQYKAINGIDERAVVQTAADFYEAANQLIELLPTLISYMGSILGLLHQWPNRGANDGVRECK